jgi:integrase
LARRSLSTEVLALDVEDLDLPNRRAKVRRKGGAADVIVWQTGTARLLPRLLKGRKSGPVFITERKARVQLPAADLDERGHARLSYQQAAALFSATSGGATLHQLRRSALTHDVEDGTGTPMLMARSGHTSVRSLAKHARVSAEVLARHQAERELPAVGGLGERELDPLVDLHWTPAQCHMRAGESAGPGHAGAPRS